MIASVLPLKADSNGVIRVGGTRVRLDTVVNAFNGGAAPDAILDRFPTLELADIYAAIFYYLSNRAAVDEYIQQQEIEAAEIRQGVEAEPGYQAFRQKLLSRKR